MPSYPIHCLFTAVEVYKRIWAKGEHKRQEEAGGRGWKRERKIKKKNKEIGKIKRRKRRR